jgi:hypothetical protein
MSVVKFRKTWWIFGKYEAIYECPSCMESLRSDLDEIGSNQNCPKCDFEFVVPGSKEFSDRFERKNVEERIEKVTESLNEFSEIADHKSNKIKSICESEFQPSFLIINSGEYQITVNPNNNLEKEIFQKYNELRKMKYWHVQLQENPNIQIGVNGKVCPYCLQIMKDGRKTTCDKCGKHHLIRNGIKDYKITYRIRHEDEEIMKEMREIEEGAHDFYMYKKCLIAAAREIMVRHGEVSFLNEKAELFMLEIDAFVCRKLHAYGSYRNIQMDQGSIYREIGDIERSLNKFLATAYIDANEPKNSYPNADPVLLKEFPVWEPKKYDHPVAFEIALDLAGDIGFSIEKVKSVFIDEATKEKKLLGSPLSPEQAFLSIMKVMRKQNLL